MLILADRLATIVPPDSTSRRPNEMLWHTQLTETPGRFKLSQLRLFRAGPLSGAVTQAGRLHLAPTGPVSTATLACAKIALWLAVSPV